MPSKPNVNHSLNPFTARVLEIVRAIPRGKVLSYGQVALLAGAPRGARQVGRILYARGAHRAVAARYQSLRWTFDIQSRHGRRTARVVGKRGRHVHARRCCEFEKTSMASRRAHD